METETKLNVTQLKIASANIESANFNTLKVQSSDVVTQADIALTDGQPTDEHVRTLFTSDNTSLNAAIDAEIAARCASLDPAKSSIKDIINALKGNN